MRTGQLHNVIEMTKLIHSRFDIAEILQVLVNTLAAEITQADLVSFFVREGTGYRGLKCNILPDVVIQQYIDPQEDQFVRRILETRSTDYIKNVALDDRIDSLKKKTFHIQSILGIPLILDDEVWGMAFAHDFGRPMNITREQIELAEAFVSMAGVAIRNHYMFEQKQRWIQQQQNLLDLSSRLSVSTTIGQIMQVCAEGVLQAGCASGLFVHRYEEESQTFKPLYHRKGGSGEEDLFWTDIEEDVFQVTLRREGIPCFERYVPCSDAAPRVQGYTLNAAFCERYGIGSLMHLPLITKDRMIGMLTLFAKEIPVCTPEETEVCKLISELTAAALYNVMHTAHLDQAVRLSTSELLQANMKLEELVRELRSADEIKNGFISSLSHELRTPITSIKGTIDILLRDILGHVNKDQRQLLQMASSSVTHLLEQINDLLDLAKLGSGKLDLTWSPAVFGEVVEEAVSMLEPLFLKKEQKVNVSGAKGIQLKLDRLRIRQVLINLLSNANKFTPPYGLIEVTFHADEQMLTVAVRDNGIGIPKSKQPHIFTKFFQVDNGAHGTGIGLSFSKELVELHGGCLTFESEEGSGSTFRMTLPLNG
ncbi:MULTISPECIES: ATP-binding protein [Paenibacillus]|uniref:ATP-binding protein n=1 Tax=Paenibacillus TaxID=44249 RepID=UPI0022B8A6FD|nr:ATP-binding protein [Paenibacillus caseinilyticus]MCZ8523972.1 ATP-binding protein [Paenibacillus caseinilyticus]